MRRNLVEHVYIIWVRRIDSRYPGGPEIPRMKKSPDFETLIFFDFWIGARIANVIGEIHREGIDGVESDNVI